MCSVLRTFRISFVFLSFLVIFGRCSSTVDRMVPENPSAVEEPKPVIHKVEITQMKFTPDVIRVKKGDKIVFVNLDIVTHDVTEQTQKAWSSAPLTTNQTWELVATESADYFCSIHPVMKGRIVVE